MATIVQATGSQIVAIQGGSATYVGSFDAVAIDLDVTNNGAWSVPALRLLWINSLMAAAGIDTYHLTAIQQQYGTAAYLWACVVEYLELSAQADPVACDTTSDRYQAARDGWESKIVFAKSKVCYYISRLGLTDTDYCQPTTKWDSLFTTDYINRR